MPEKDVYELGPVEQYTNVSDIYDDSHYTETARIVAEKGMRFGEAADIYGDIETAEDYGYVTRGCVKWNIYPSYGGTRDLHADDL